MSSTTDLFVTRTHCPGCESQEFKELWSAPFDQDPVAGFLQTFYANRLNPTLLCEQPFSISECNRCHLVFQRHILNDHGMGLLYSEWINAETSLRKRQTAKKKLFRKYAAEAEMIARLIDKPPHDIAVVEFGMGWGYWSRMAKAFNYQVTGIELSPVRVAHAASMGVDSVPDITQIDQGSVDFVYANQVFEHLAEPLQTMRALASLLASDGMMLVRVPDGRHTADQLREHGWRTDLEAIHPLEHINAFSPAALLDTAGRAGLKPARVPLRLGMRSVSNLWNSAKREFNDRFREPHVYLVKA